MMYVNVEYLRNNGYIDVSTEDQKADEFIQEAQEYLDFFCRKSFTAPIPALIKRWVGLFIQLKINGQIDEVLMSTYLSRQKSDRYEYELNENGNRPFIGNGELDFIINIHRVKGMKLDIGLI